MMLIDTKGMKLHDYIQKVYVPKDKFHLAKRCGKLTGYVPQVGQVCVLEGYDEAGLVIRSPNSVKDYIIELEDGTKVRKNLCNKDVEGFIDV